MQHFGRIFDQRGYRSASVQVEIERRFAFVLHHTVKRLMDGVSPIVVQCLDQGTPQPPVRKQREPEGPAVESAEPVTETLSQHLQLLAPALDPRVLRRAARELWNSCAGVSDLRFQSHAASVSAMLSLGFP